VALIPYITAGDPHPRHTVALMHAMVSAGADLIELGVPFSDPMADGPVIQAACERALAHQVSLAQVLNMVETFRQRDTETPVVLMGYLNPVEAMGHERFCSAAVAAGVDGVLTVDLPPEEDEGLQSFLRSAGLDIIYLVAPTTNERRLAAIGQKASGFIYYVSLKGVTGSNALDVNAVSAKLADIRAHSDLPVGVGFGIGTPEAAARVAECSDAVVVGSALVRRIAENDQSQEAMLQAATELLGGMRAAMDERSGTPLCVD
jgi:tryptophan synthase alpha chain